MNLTYDQWVASLGIWREARGESMPAKAAVFAVMQNRAEDSRFRWPRTLSAVVTQPYQFSSFNANDSNVTKWPNPLHLPDWNAFLDCCSVVTAALQADPTDGANFYYDSSILPPAEAWLGKGHSVEELMAKKTCQIGRLSFFKID